MGYAMRSEQARTIVRGIVRQGSQRGVALGFPTANLAIAGLALPAGVYSDWLRRADGEVHASAISVEQRPALLARRGVRLVKAHILDFETDIYGEVVIIALEARLREERYLPIIDELVAQMEADVVATRLRWEHAKPRAVLPVAPTD